MKFSYPSDRFVIDTALDRFNSAQRRLARLLLRGYTNKEIADELAIAESSVKKYLSVIYQMSGAANRAQFITRFSELFKYIEH